MSAPLTLSQAKRQITRLRLEKEELRKRHSEHMRIYSEMLSELVTLKMRNEQAARILQGGDE